jgi:hypothetical protein
MVTAHLVAPAGLARGWLAVATARTTDSTISIGRYDDSCCYEYEPHRCGERSRSLSVMPFQLREPAQYSPRGAKCSANGANGIRRSPVRPAWRNAENSEEKRKRGVGRHRGAP